MCTTRTLLDSAKDSSGQHGRPLYTIGVTAELLGVHPRTLRIYEEKNLLLPARRAGWRYYSKRDVVWAKGIQYLLHNVGMSIAGLQRVLALIPCSELLSCSGTEKKLCPKPGDKHQPCWAAAPRPDHTCYQCQVYQSAPSWVLEEDELADFEAFAKNGID
jgi:MerR family transcriptional regulator/heat shock protein HspR